jgi:hypothetical protein
MKPTQEEYRLSQDEQQNIAEFIEEQRAEYMVSPTYVDTFWSEELCVLGDKRFCFDWWCEYNGVWSYEVSFHGYWDTYYGVIERKLARILNQRPEPTDGLEIAMKILPDILKTFAIRESKVVHLEAEYEKELRQKFDLVSVDAVKSAFEDWLTLLARTQGFASRCIYLELDDSDVEDSMPVQFAWERLEKCEDILVQEADALDQDDDGVAEMLQKLGLSKNVTYAQVVAFAREGSWTWTRGPKYRWW